jgi:lysophospholipase L1-like esterase
MAARGAQRQLYKEMTDQLVALREQFGIPVYSLLDVFQDTKEEIYQDRAHVNELGNEIMARRVADLIAEVWGWPRKRLQQPATEGSRNGPP